LLFFLPSLKPTTGNNFKVFFEDVNDETPTSMETNFMHKIESTTNTTLLVGLAHCERHGYSLLCIKIVLMVQTRQYLQTDAGRKKVSLIFKQEHCVQKVWQPLKVWKRILMTCSRLLELK